MVILEDIKIAQQKLDESKEIMVWSKETYEQLKRNSDLPSNIFFIGNSNTEFGKTYLITNKELKTNILDQIHKGTIKTLN